MAATVYQGSASYPGSRGGVGPVVTVGNFDGVHVGHQALIRRVIARARELGGPACVYTFEPAPRDVIRPDNGIPRIQSLTDKLACLEEVGVDEIVVEPFDLELAAKEPRWFAEEVLTRRLGCSALVLGWDFRFGRKRGGTAEDLKGWMDVPVESIEVERSGDEIASSSRIRELVRAGKVEEAARMLTRPHRVRGVVKHGDKRGRTIGFPTANVAIETALWPSNGVYAVRAVTAAGERYDAVANLGIRPTFGGSAPSLEVHLFDFAGDLYDQPLAVDFVARLRDERKFDGLQALVAQIQADAAQARGILASAPHP